MLTYDSIIAVLPIGPSPDADQVHLSDQKSCASIILSSGSKIGAHSTPRS
jgi:hypothetical protein